MKLLATLAKARVAELVDTDVLVIRIDPGKPDRYRPLPHRPIIAIFGRFPKSVHFPMLVTCTAVPRASGAQIERARATCWPLRSTAAPLTRLELQRMTFLLFAPSLWPVFLLELAATTSPK